MRQILSLKPTLSSVLIFALLYSSCTSAMKEESDDTVIQVEEGLISGTVNESGDIVSYKGIPFAAPPVNGLRWKEPQLHEKWDGIRQCLSFGASPMQPKPTPFNVYTSEFLIPEKEINEDCLYLNVWADTKNKGKKKPVFVWIYGGGFSSGGAAVPIYDGEAMAKKGLVFVSINYRVGPFGFLAHPGLTAESETHASGNYGLLDQIAALKWVRRNIEAFGGDPDNVTIAGQSAGSMSVNALVASPLAKGLFHKAIAQSGSNLLPTGLVFDLKMAEEQGEALAKALNAQSVSDLRKLPAEEILQQAKARFVLVVDGYVIPQPISEIFANGLHADIPLLTGWNADEGFVSNFKNKEEYRREAREKYSEDADKFLMFYPAGSDEEAAASQIALSRDMIFGLSNFKWAGIQSTGKAPAYVYYFTRKPPATGDFVKYGAFHTAEVGYALNNLKFINRAWEPVDYQLAEIMSDYWANFAINGNPNGKGMPEWPEFDNQNNQIMLFDDKAGAAPLPGKERLEFLYSILVK